MRIFALFFCAVGVHSADFANPVQYDRLGSIVHNENQLFDKGGRQYKPDSDGQGNWRHFSSKLGEHGWMSRPSIASSTLNSYGILNNLTGLYAEARVCDKDLAERCRHEYEHCRLYEGSVENPDKHQMEVGCHCASIYYTQCLPAAGCSTAYMHECYDVFKKFRCPDTTLCGNNCVMRANEVGAEAIARRNKAITIQVLNDGMNFLKISTCNKTRDQAALDHYALINDESCDLHSFRQCPFWIPPRTLTSLTFDQDTSYILVEFCILMQNISIRCLDSPRPVRVSSTPIRWPSVLQVMPTERLYCDQDIDCPSSECRKIKQPPHVCKRHNLNTTTFRGFTQGGDPYIIQEDWKVVIHHEVLDDFQSDTESRS